MNTARIVVLAIAIGAGGIAAYLASGSNNNPAPAQPVAQMQTVDILISNSEIILCNVRVLAIDQAPKEKEGSNSLVGKTVTLELKPEQAETLARSRQSGSLTLALRSIADVNAVEKPDDQQSNKRGENLNVIRYGVASQQMMQK